MRPVLSDTIAELSKDHVAFRRALNVLARQVTDVAELRDPDFDALRGVLTYLSIYPGRFHHPVEDLIYTALCERAPEKAHLIHEIADEHRLISAELGGFASAVRAVLADVELSRPNFCKIARKYLELERAHIRREEGTFYNMAAVDLTPEDWGRIDSQMRAMRAPIINGDQRRFWEELHENIVSWDYESRHPEPVRETGLQAP